MAFFIYSLLISTAWAQELVPNITNTVERGMNTECKKCPYSLCANIAAYDSEQSVTSTCWTRGTEIGGDTTWLQTTDNCYVTQYDLTTYNGTYEEDLPYCGAASEREFYTKAPARTKYMAECMITPWRGADYIAYHKYGKDLTVTCYADNEDQIINDATWVKTTQNCYVAQIHLTEKVDKTELEACGPIPNLSLNSTSSADTVSPDDRSAAQSSTIAPHSQPQFDKRYLVNVTVGEDYALCHREARVNSTVVRRYPWEREVWLQCLEIIDNPENVTDRYWSLTTDFCYVRSVDFWQSPEGDNYRFPQCYRFT
ncbi:hypothetical protein B0O99DRAFT_681143 [Bisporella sp. PMI_857]|nr:hypothetical protein B0O99DRAFT_681143 [Bisporella sp. PMI_857]